nr:rhomboid family intramembrane serine protease [Treponema socranskii]
MQEHTEVRSKIRVTYNAPVTLTFVAVCTLIMLLDTYVFDRHLAAALFIIPGGKYSSHPFDWRAPLDYFRLFSHVFGHADWQHLIANMSLVLLLGPIIESRYGSRVLALVITITALVTGVINACLITHPEMGASDVVFMMIMLASFTSFAKNEIPLSFILVFILYIGGQFFNFGTLQHNGISVIAHIAGGLCGSLFAFLLTPQNFPAGAQNENSAKQNGSERAQNAASESASERDVKIGAKKSAFKKHTKGGKKR